MTTLSVLCPDCGADISSLSRKFKRCKPCGKKRRDQLVRANGKKWEDILKDMECRYPGCDYPPRRMGGYCSSHAERKRLGRDMAPPLKSYHRTAGKQCLVLECERQRVSMNLCGAHYLRKVRGKPLGGLISPRIAKTTLVILGLRRQIVDLKLEITALQKQRLSQKHEQNHILNQSDVAKIRQCITCHGVFPSSGYSNRICPRCAKENLET